jgi:hypothetical protein
VRPEDFQQIEENRHGILAGSILLPTETPITAGGGTSRDFVEQQGGDETTFIFLFGLREAEGPLGVAIGFIEGVFLSEAGPGFHPTWDHEQLLREVDLGGWRVVKTSDVLESWVGRVEERMNKS